MSVPEGRRGHGKFELLVQLNKLALYTMEICSNPKTFKREEHYKAELTDDLVKTAQDIYIKAKLANDINVGKDAFRAWERKRLQESAIQDCGALLARIDLAHRAFHLSEKRVKYWGKLTVDAKSGLQRWKDSDSKRYEALL